MPCNDVTETLLIKLDHTYSIQKYTLQKRTCGAEVAQRSLLQEWVQNQSADKLMTMSTAEFLDIFKPETIADQFALLKHFDTLKMALQVLVGDEDASKNSRCVIEDLIYNDNGVYAVMFIGLPEIDTTKIEACAGGCSSGGCG